MSDILERVSDWTLIDILSRRLLGGPTRLPIGARLNWGFCGQVLEQMRERHGWLREQQLGDTPRSICLAALRWLGC